MECFSLLLVEDNILNQKLILLNLEKFGISIDTADNGLKGVELFKERTYSLILMDIMMPEMDGFEATKNIRKIEKERGVKHTPIVGLTANIFEADKEKCFKSGMDDFMTKPFDLEIFKEVLVKLGVNFAEKIFEKK